MELPSDTESLRTWSERLRESDRRHLVDLDHKDCGELAGVIERIVVHLVVWRPVCFGEQYQGADDPSCRNCIVREICIPLYDKEHYPHDKDCEGQMCWCAVRAKKADPERYAKWEQGIKDVRREIEHGEGSIIHRLPLED